VQIDADQAAFQDRRKHLGQVLGEAGLYFRGRAQFATAKATYERALRVKGAAYAPDHPTVAVSVNNLGEVLRELGDLEGALVNYQRALTISEAALGPDHPTVGTVVNNVGLVLRAQGDLDGARATSSVPWGSSRAPWAPTTCAPEPSPTTSPGSKTTTNRCGMQQAVPQAAAWGTGTTLSRLRRVPLYVKQPAVPLAELRTPRAGHG
jgi:hypothetical protein